MSFVGRRRQEQDMQIIEIEEVKSGEHEGSLWVSMVISSADPQDVLHVVCVMDVMEDDREMRQDDLYLERNDQSQGGNGFVNEVILSNASTTFMFNEEGQSTLGFPSQVRFVFPTSLAGAREALICLQEMSKLEAGRSIKT